MRMSRLCWQALACRTLLTFTVLNPVSASSVFAEDLLSSEALPERS